MVKFLESVLDCVIAIKQWIQRKIGDRMEVNNIKENFSTYYERLILDEQELEVLMNAYAKGDDVKMADIDACFKNMKESLREIRKLAIEYKEKKEKAHDE